MPLVETDCTIVNLPVLLALGTEIIFDTQFGKVADIAEGVPIRVLGFKQKEVT